MADTTTSEKGYVKPEPFASTNLWGQKLNANFDAIDEDMAAVEAVADAAAPQSRTLGSAGGTLSGLGDLSANRPNIEVVPNTTTQKIEVSKADSLVATRKRINFVDGAFVSINVEADEADEDTVNVTVTGSDSETEITKSLSTIGKASSIERTGFDGQFITTTPAVKATVPSGRICIRPLVVVTNNSDTDEGVACWFVASGSSAGNANKVWSSGYLRVPAGSSRVIGEGRMIVMGAGSTVVLQSESTTTVLSVRISMETVPDSNTAFHEAVNDLGTSLATFRTILNTTSRICWIAHNHSAAFAGLTVAYRPSGAGADSAAYNVGFYNGVDLLEPGQTVVYDQPDVLNAGDEIRVAASAGSAISFRLSVLELA